MLPLVISDALAVGVVVNSVIAVASFLSTVGPRSGGAVEIMTSMAFGLMLFNTYRFGRHPAAQFRDVFAASATTGAFMSIVFALRGEYMLTTCALVAALLSGISTYCLRSVVRRFFSRFQWWGIPVIAIGGGQKLNSAVDTLRARPWLGLRPVGFVASSASSGNMQSMLVDVRTLAGHGKVTRALVECERLEDRVLGDITSLFSTVYLTRPAHVSSLWSSSEEIGGGQFLVVRPRLFRPSYRIAKRLLDIGLSAGLLILLSPILLVLSLIVKLTSSGPVFYRQRRIGRRGNEIRPWKFRTMRPNADEILATVLASDPDLRAEWERDHKLKNDPRVTKVGGFLRATSLDELPQLWNILCGDMSAVGPRPIVEDEISKYGDAFSLYKRVTPGLTGMWQISGRNNTTYDERVALDRYYVNNWSIGLDLYILLRTAKTVVLREGAY